MVVVYLIICNRTPSTLLKSVTFWNSSALKLVVMLLLLPAMILVAMCNGIQSLNQSSIWFYFKQLNGTHVLLKHCFILSFSSVVFSFLGIFFSLFIGPFLFLTLFLSLSFFIIERWLNFLYLSFNNTPHCEQEVAKHDIWLGLWHLKHRRKYKFRLYRLFHYWPKPFLSLFKVYFFSRQGTGSVF